MYPVSSDGHPPDPVNRILLRGVLNDVTPIVARVISAPYDFDIRDLHYVFLESIINPMVARVDARQPVHAQEQRVSDRGADIEPVGGDEVDIVCLTWRGAAPLEHCGDPPGYSLMFRCQAAGSQFGDPDFIAASVQRLSHVNQDYSRIDWQQVITDGWKSVEARSGSLTPTRFSVQRQ